MTENTFPNSRLINWFKLSSPSTFYPLAGKLIPFFWALTVIFGAIGLSAVGSFLLGEEKSQRLAIGVIIGSFAGNQFAEPINKAIGDKVSFLNQGTIAIAILVLCIVICMLGKNVRDSKWPKSKIKAVVSGLLSALAGVGYIIANLSEQARNSLVTDHNLAAMVYDLRLYLMGALILWLLATYLTVGKAKR